MKKVPGLIACSKPNWNLREDSNALNFLLCGSSFLTMPLSLTHGVRVADRIQCSRKVVQAHVSSLSEGMKQMTMHILYTHSRRAFTHEMKSIKPGCRDAVLDALSPLGNAACGGEGAIYFWAQLPPGTSQGRLPLSHSKT